MSDLEENDWINQTIDINKYSFEAVLGDQLDGSGLQYSQSDGDISQDEVIDYANQEENNQQLSALQEYLSMIDGEDDVSNDET